MFSLHYLPSINLIISPFSSRFRLPYEKSFRGFLSSLFEIFLPRTWDVKCVGFIYDEGQYCLFKHQTFWLLSTLRVKRLLAFWLSPNTSSHADPLHCLLSMSSEVQVLVNKNYIFSLRGRRREKLLPKVWRESQGC